MNRQLLRTFLERFDLNKAPNAIIIESSSASVLLLRTPTGYAGTPFSKADRRACRYAFSVTLEGESAGLVSPAQSTNFMAQAAPGSKERVERSQYIQQINAVLAAAVAAAEAEDMTYSMINEELLKTHPEFSFEGRPSKKNTAAAMLAGAPQLVLDHAAVMGIAVAVDVETALVRASRWHNRFVGVEAGEWDETSDRLARDYNLASGLVYLAKVAGGVKLIRPERAGFEAERTPRVVGGTQGPSNPVLTEEQAKAIAAG